MIGLRGEKPFGRGSHREVYRHPEKLDRCLKVMIEDWRECDRRKRAGFLSRTFRTKWYFHESYAELRFSNDLRKRLGEKAWGYVAQSHEMVETDLGEALEVDLVRDADGGISQSLKGYLVAYGMTAECEAAIEHFWEGGERYGIFVQGRPDNVSVRMREDGSCELVAIDGFGLPQLVPLARWSKSARRRFFKKRRRKQDGAIRSLLALREAGAEVDPKGLTL